MKPGEKITALNNKEMIVDAVISKERGLFTVLDNDERKILEIHDRSFSFDGGESAFRRWIAGPPDAAFVWPETRLKDNVYGYVYASHQSDYIPMSTLLTNIEMLKDFNVNSVIKACIAIINAYRNAYMNGEDCINIEDHDILINPKTGNVLIYGFEKMTIPINQIYNKYTFKPPEMVEMEDQTLEYSWEEFRYANRFALSVILFELCFWCHPFIGRKSYEIPLATLQAIKNIYGKSAVFVFDPTDGSNRLVMNKYSEKRWNSFPKYIRDYFLQAFSKESIQMPENRKSFYDWKELFARINNDIIQCKSCGSHIIFDDERPVCPCCNQSTGIEYIIETRNYRFPASKGKIMSSLIDLSSSTYGEIVESKSHPNILGIRNLTNSNWVANIHGRNIRQFSHDEVVPIKEGVEIRTGHGVFKVIRLTDNYINHKMNNRNVLDVELQPKQTLPLICVVDTSNAMNAVGIEELKNMLIEAIGTLNEAAENCDYDLEIVILYYADEIEWAPMSGFSSFDDLLIDIPAINGKANLGKALKTLNTRMTKGDLFSKRNGGYFINPIIMFCSSGGSDDDFTEGLTRIRENCWFKSSTVIALKTDETFVMDILNEISGNIESVVKADEADKIKKYISIPLD